MLTPRIKMEMKGRKYSSFIELMEYGIKVALITDHPYNSIDQIRTIIALAMAEGLRRKDAIKSLTVHPAEIIECHHRIGRIKEGFDGDLVIFDGDPLNLNSKVMMTLIDGKVVYNSKKS